MPTIYKTIILDRKTGNVKERKDPVEISQEILTKNFQPLAEYYGQKLSDSYIKQNSKVGEIGG